MSSDPIARKPGQFAAERFRARHRAWLRRVQWLLGGVAVAELGLTVAVGAVFQPSHMSFYWGLGLGIAVTTLLTLGDSPPEHIDKWRRGAYGEKATAKRLRGLVAVAWIQGTQLADALIHQPAKMRQADIERAGTLIRSLCVASGR